MLVGFLRNSLRQRTTRLVRPVLEALEDRVAPALWVVNRIDDPDVATIWNNPAQTSLRADRQRIVKYGG